MFSRQLGGLTVGIGILPDISIKTQKEKLSDLNELSDVITAVFG